MKKRYSLRKIISNNWFIFKHALKQAPGYIFLVCLLPILQAIIMFLQQIYVITFIMDSIQFGRPFTYVAYRIAGIFLIYTLWSFAFNKFTYGGYLQKVQLRLARNMRLHIYEKASKMDLKCYDDPDYYNDFVWSMSEASNRINSVVSSVATLTKTITAILISGIFMLSFEFVGVILVGFSFLFNFLINLALNKVRHKMTVDLQQKGRKRDYINRVFYIAEFAKEIRLSNVKNKLFKEFDKVSGEIIEEAKKQSKKIAILDFINRFLFNTFVFYGIYVAYLVFRVAANTLSYGALIGLFQASRNLHGHLNGFSEVLPSFQNNSLYIDKLREFMDYEPEISDAKDDKSIPNKLSSLDLRDVSFSYNKNDSILNNINLEIKPKQKVAIVGYNGAGKTTLVNLLMRLYDPKRGSISYDDVDIKNYKLNEYRSKIGAVFQDYQCFAAKLSENVTMDSSVDESRAKNSLERVGFIDRLKMLENGLNTQLTNEFYDEGTDFSGGEMQKIAIARVLYKNSDIIILDEPSSALDPISEYQLNETIREVATNKTVVFISHRLSTIKMADEIFMMENGKVIERGSHDELMKLNGKYAEMYIVQAEKYKISKCS